MTERLLIEALDRLSAAARHVDLWLRDDDCMQPTAALDDFLSLTNRHAIPATLAVIPAGTDEMLVRRLEAERHVMVAVHGWSHTSYAPEGAKKRELGADRPSNAIREQLRAGFSRLDTLHGERFLPMLVPPWNRIDPAVTAMLPDLGYRAVSTFGPERPAAVAMLNTHVDVIDWRGGRGGRDADLLFSEIAALCRPAAIIGVLTHHLVHDAAVTDFLARLFALTAGHPGCRWRSAADILARGLPLPAFPGDQET